MSTEPDIATPDHDPSSYVRTYAKDLAAASGKNQSLEHEKPKKKDRHPAVVKTPPPVPVPVPTPPIAPTVTEREVPVIVPPPIQIREVTPIPPPLKPIEPAPPVPAGPERDAILARLKARVLAEQAKPVADTPMPVFTSAPTPAAPRPVKSLLQQPVETVSYREPLPVVAPEAPLAAPVPIPAPPVADAGPAPLHTYTSDFADRIVEQKASRFSVLAAEKDAHVRVPRTKKSPLVPIIVGILLVVVGSGGVVAAYFYMKSAAPIAGIIAPPSLITPDTRVQLSGTGTSLLQALTDQAAKPLAANTVALTYINISTTTSQGVVEEPGTGGAFITELNLPAPDILLRNIDPSSMVGIVNAGGNTSPFFILRVTSYERTFSGMLSWEESMGSDLSLLYPRYPAPVVAPPVATTTTATTTPIPASNGNASEPAAQFVDEIVANHDTRALKDMAGRTIVLYGYVDKQTLIICRDEAAFSLLIGRLAVAPQ